MSAGCGAEHETAFTVDASRVTFGAGSLAEVGDRLRRYLPTGGRIAVFTDAQVRALPWVDEVLASLSAAGFSTVIFDAVAIEPTDGSISDAVDFARAERPDAYVSVGGGSVIDTAKLANLLATHDGDLLDYVNAPLGAARAVPGPLAPHLACPTTSGTGSEVTPMAIFDLLAAHAKTGVSSPALRPSEAIVDPRVSTTLPPTVVAASGLDVLCHALESLTARPFTARPVADPRPARPASQGANPWSDLGCREALSLIGTHLRAAVAGEETSRHQMMWAATLAGIAFGNAGVHVPHAMAYAVAGRVTHYRPTGYPSAHPGADPSPDPLVPHGFAVAVTAPAAFRALAPTSPDRHLLGARLLDPTLDAGPDRRATEPGEALAQTVATLMRDIGAPNGLTGVGYGAADVPNLVASAAPQRRLLDNAPMPVHEPELGAIFASAVTCW